VVVEDLAPYFAAFGQDCTIAGGTIVGIFDSQYDRALGIVDSSTPVLTIKTSDWSSVSRGASVTVASVAYTVTGIEPDGTGITLLRLQRT